MIALGGVIGAGLFVGSGAIIASAGPAAILSYLIGGSIVTLVMFMLGEMAIRTIDSGSFSTFASMYLGEWAGYSVGWLYWFKSMITITIEAILLGAILHDFLPGLPVWVGALLMLLIVISSNIYSVRSFGEAEYWLSFAKISAILIFMVLGVSILLNLQSGFAAPGLANLTAHGGFMPNGMGPVLAGVTVVIFSLGGSEIAAVAAGESENPRENVIKAIRSVIFRVMVFYVGSVSILILCLPWTDTVNLKSPYVALFSLAGYPWAATALKIVLFVSFMSVMNSFLFSNSRMMYSLSQRGYAPALFGRTNARGVPLNALALSFTVCVAILMVHFVSGGDLFMTLAKSSGAFIMMVWIVIILAHARMRMASPASTSGEIPFKAWLYPYGNGIALLTLMAVLLSLAFNPDTRFQFVFMCVITVAIIASYFTLRSRPVQTTGAG
ncbi:amino acid permease [Pseudoduganella sp. OTU4001]|uniref:amino acid permease n=1 Tax=Pseudoduganella sp. OTU4001 TaxID=3043854 RepID=UPI00313E2EE6